MCLLSPMSLQVPIPPGPCTPILAIVNGGENRKVLRDMDILDPIKVLFENPCFLGLPVILTGAHMGVFKNAGRLIWTQTNGSLI